MPDSVMVFHPGTSMSTSDVCAGLIAGLQAHGVHVEEYPLDVQIALHGRLLEWLWQENGRQGQKYTSTDVIYKAGKELLADACRARRLHGVEWILVVSGMYQHPDFLVYLRDVGFKVAVLLTESPYDLEQELEAIDRRAVTGAREPVANVVFTNERTCLEACRAIQPRSDYLPHAWNPAAAAPDPAQDAQIPSYDVVHVGTYFEERVQFLRDIDWTDLRLGLYGTTDEIRLMARARRGPAWLPESVRRGLEPSRAVTELQAAARIVGRHIRGGYVPTAATQALYRRATVGLNFHRTSKGYLTGAHITAPAESLNPRCYELAAAGCFFASDPRAELAERLPMVPTFTSAGECEAIIRRAIAEPAWRQAIAAAAQAAVQPHTWTARARTVLDALASAEGRAVAA